MQEILNQIKKETQSLYKKYKLINYIFHTISILLNIFTIIVCPIIILLDYYKITNVVIASAIIGFINNIVFNLSGLSIKFNKKIEKCLKLEKVILKNVHPTRPFVMICKRELQLIREPCFQKKTKKYIITNTSNTAEEIYQIDRYCVFGN